MRPGAQALEAYQYNLFRHLKNEIFSRNLGQNMPKNAYILEKGCKIAAAPGAPPPNPRLLPAAGNSAPRSLRCYSHILIQI